MTMAQIIYRLWVYGELMCKMTGYMQGNKLKVLLLLSSFVSIMTMIVIDYCCVPISWNILMLCDMKSEPNNTLEYI